MRLRVTGCVLAVLLAAASLHGQIGSITPHSNPALDAGHGIIGLHVMPDPSTWALAFAGLFMTVAFRALSKKRRV